MIQKKSSMARWAELGSEDRLALLAAVLITVVTASLVVYTVQSNLPTRSLTPADDCDIEAIHASDDGSTTVIVCRCPAPGSSP